MDLDVTAATCAEGLGRALTVRIQDLDRPALIY